MPTTTNDLVTPFSILANPDSRGTYEGQITSGKREDTLVFLVTFENGEQFLAELVGKREQYGEGGSAQIIANEPLRHPWNENLFADSCSWRAIGTDKTVSLSRPWTHLEVRVTFRALTWTHDDPSQPYLSYRVAGSGAAVAVPGWQQTLVTSGDRIEGDVTRLVPQKGIQVTRYNIPRLATFETTADALMGCVNNATLTIKGRSYAAGTVYFATYSATEENQGLGQTQASADLQLIYRPIGWNKTYNSSFSVDTYTLPPYATADLSPLFS